MQELRRKYVLGMRAMMPPEASKATWLVDKVHRESGAAGTAGTAVPMHWWWCPVWVAWQY